MILNQNFFKIRIVMIGISTINFKFGYLLQYKYFKQCNC